MGCSIKIKSKLFLLLRGRKASIIGSIKIKSKIFLLIQAEIASSPCLIKNKSKLSLLIKAVAAKFVGSLVRTFASQKLLDHGGRQHS